MNMNQSDNHPDLIMSELVDAYARQNIAEFVLGPKGEHFDGDEWERRADWWHARGKIAEAMVMRDV